MAFKKEITVSATLENISSVTAFVEENLEIEGCPVSKITKLNIAIDEVFSNIANYAYGQNKGDVTIFLSVTDEPKSCSLIFQDDGIPFNPLTKESPDITLSAEERKIGGLGIMIVKNLMDSTTYEYKDNHNILTLKLKF